MPKIETQGVSQDYKVATGSYDTIDRGDLSKEELAEILKSISKLSAPEGDNDCPPAILVNTSDGSLSLFGDSGMLNCLDSIQEVMSPSEALKIITGEISIEEFDISKGHEPKKNNSAIVFGVVLALAIIIAGLGFAL